MNLLPGAQLLDALLGEKPEPPELYNWRADPRARSNPDERRSIEIHYDNCMIRQIEIKQMFSQTRLERWRDRVDRYNDRKLLLMIVGLMLANTVGARELIAAFFP